MNKIHIKKKYFPKKRFGQHFLRDINIVNSIINYINPKIDEKIIEIGPGFGALTEKILKFVDKITVIEIDSNIVEYLNKNNNFKNKLKILNKDVMKINFFSFFKKKKLLRIFGNIPYNISTSFIFYLLKYNNIINDMHFMFQKEVVDRLIAKPDNKNYGKLSVMAQCYYNITPLIEVPSNSFWPIPKVKSTLVRIIPNNKLPFFSCNFKKLSKVTNIAFSQRRKMIKNSLKNILNKKKILELNIDLKSRAENLSIENYFFLSKLI